MNRFLAFSQCQAKQDWRLTRTSSPVTKNHSRFCTHLSISRMWYVLLTWWMIVSVLLTWWMIVGVVLDPVLFLVLIHDAVTSRRALWLQWAWYPPTFSEGSSEELSSGVPNGRWIIIVGMFSSEANLYQKTPTGISMITLLSIVNSQLAGYSITAGNTNVL